MSPASVTSPPRTEVTSASATSPPLTEVTSALATQAVFAAVFAAVKTSFEQFTASLATQPHHHYPKVAPAAAISATVTSSGSSSIGVRSRKGTHQPPHLTRVRVRPPTTSPHPSPSPTYVPAIEFNMSGTPPQIPFAESDIPAVQSETSAIEPTVQSNTPSIQPKVPESDLAKIKRIFQDAVRNRPKRYGNVMTFHVRFGFDDTGTESDWRAFASMISALGYPSPVKLVLENNERLPGVVVGRLMDEIMRKCATSAGQSLVIGHYSGHGMSIDDTLFFSNATGSSKFSYRHSFARITNNDYDLAQTDVLLLLDSCYSGLATRNGQQASRIVEICSAMDANEFALGSSPQRPTNTFTSRLVTEVMKCLGQGKMIVEFASVIAHLRQDGSHTRKTRYRLVCGTHGLKVPSFKMRPTATTQVGTASRRQNQTSSSSSAALASDSPITDLRAVFVVHLGDSSVDDDEVKHVVSWIDKLPASVGMEIQSVFRSESTTMVLSAPWALWSVLDGLRGFTLAAEVQSHNLLDHIRGATQGFQPLPLQQVQNLPHGSKAESSKNVHRAD